jgi:CheY-like chemotaxis protein
LAENKRVLIVDDDPDYLEAITSLLESASYEVRSATTGGEGLKLARALLPDLILLDVMLAERTEGFSILKQLREIPALARTPVIIISSIYSDSTAPVFEVSPDAGWVPADLYMAKPVDPRKLLEAAARLTSR